MFRMKRPTPFRLTKEILSAGPLSWVYLLFGCPISITPDHCVIQLLSQGYSFVRWGDGETAIVRKKSISYQESVEELREKLINLSEDPPEKLVFGFPWVTYASPFDRRWNKRIFGIMFSTRVYWARKYRIQFVDGKLSRTEFWWDHANEISVILQNIQKSGRKLVLVGSREFLALCPQGTDLIEVSKLDAFADYDALCESIVNFYEKYQKNLSLVVAAGPTAKALVNDFGNRFQVLDIGHGFYFALNGYGSWAWSAANGKNNS
jgi:hypothetical protein